MKREDRGFTEYQRTLFNKYEVDESYLQTRKQRRACLELLEKVDKNQVGDEKKLIGKIAAAFDGTRLYKKIASCVTITALLVTLQGTPVMANASSVYQNTIVTGRVPNENTINSVVMDEDSFLADFLQKPQKTEAATVQPDIAGDKESLVILPALTAYSVIMDDDSDTFRSSNPTVAENQVGSEPVTITFENHEKIESTNGYYVYDDYYGYYYYSAPKIKYDIGGYELILKGIYNGVTWTSSASQPPDTVVQSIDYNILHSIEFSDSDFFDIESISITNNSYYTATFSLFGYNSSSSSYGSYVDLGMHEIASGEEKTIDFSHMAEADSINYLGISSLDVYGYSSKIFIDDVTISNITPRTPVVSDKTKYGTEDTVMNFTVSDFVYNDVTGDPLIGIQIVLPPNPSHGVLRMDNTELVAGSEVAAADLDKITFTPVKGFFGNATFTYKGYDGTGYSKKSATMTLSIASANTPPVAIDNNTWSTDQNRPIRNGVLTGDVTDVDEGDSLTYELVTNAAYGNVTVNADGSFVYTPNANYYGTDCFTWRVSDGIAWSNTATVTITIRKVADDKDDYYYDEEEGDTPSPHQSRLRHQHLLQQAAQFWLMVWNM